MATLVTEKRHRGNVNGLAWSPDGAVIASGAAVLGNVDSQCGVYVWDPETGKVIKTYKGLPTATQDLWWSPDSMHIAVLAWSGMLHVWNWKTGELVFAHAFPNAFWPDACAWAAWSPDGASLAVEGTDPRITIFDTKTWQPVQLDDGHAAAHSGPGYFYWSPDGSHIASHGFDHTVRLWESGSGKEVWRIPVSNGKIAWSPTGTYLAIGEQDGEKGNVTIWNVETFEPLHTLTAYHLCPRVGLAWCRSHGLLAVPGPSDTMFIYDPLAGRFVTRLHVFWACGPTWSADGSMLACGSGRSRAQVWRLDLPAR